MKIEIKVYAGAREDRVVQLEAGHYRINVRAIADKGKANKAIIGLLAKHFGVAKSRVAIRLGQKMNKKVVEIIDE